MGSDQTSSARRLAVLGLAIALTSSACVLRFSDEQSVTDDVNQVRLTPQAPPSSQATDSEQSSNGDEGTEPQKPELIATTATDEPFNLDGGATTSDDGVVIVDDNPRDDLVADTAAVTELWNTDWSRQTIDTGELFPGLRSLDPRDGIPPIDSPLFEPIGSADWITDNEPGALVRLGDEVRFYPLAILTSHEIVNDRIGDVPVSVTFCPLCNTAITFDRRVDGEVLRFGVSGLLRNSDLVMWDNKTDSLWQQLTGEGIVGHYAGTQLEIIPTAIVSYRQAKESFPDALSLAQDSGGAGRTYGRNPYVGYSSSEVPFLFDGKPDPRFPALSRVVGVSLDSANKSYPFSVLESDKVINDTVGGVEIVVMWGGATTDALDDPVISDSQQIGTALAFDRRVAEQTLTFNSIGNDQFTDTETGSTWNLLGIAIDGPLKGESLAPVPHRNEFWFAWAAFYPDSAVYPE